MQPSRMSPNDWTNVEPALPLRRCEVALDPCAGELAGRAGIASLNPFGARVSRMSPE